MLLKIKKELSIDNFENAQELLKGAFNEYDSNFVVLQKGEEIHISEKRKISLYFNSFVPDIVIDYLKLENKISVTFSLKRSVRIIVVLVWVVAFCLFVPATFYGSGDILIALLVYLGYFFISWAFAYLGLFFSSLKIMKVIKSAFQQHNNQT